jgi:hypothetical protein
LIEALQRLEQADDDTLVEFVEKMFLRRKGITVVSFKSGAHVRERLEAKGFTRLAQDVSNETLVEHMDTYVSNQDTALAEIEELIVEGAARDVVEEVGLEWPEPSET